MLSNDVSNYLNFPSIFCWMSTYISNDFWNIITYIIELYFFFTWFMPCLFSLILFSLIYLPRICLTEKMESVVPYSDTKLNLVPSIHTMVWMQSLAKHSDILSACSVTLTDNIYFCQILKLCAHKSRWWNFFLQSLDVSFFQIIKFPRPSIKSLHILEDAKTYITLLQ